MNLISYHHTNIRLVSFLLIICATSTRAQQQPTTVNTDSIFRVLDYTISQADTYLKKKQDTLRQIHEKYYQAKTTANRYEELSRLYDEYRYFNNDSALHCLYECKKVAEKESDIEKIMVTLLRLAHQYVVTGYYPEAQLYFQKVRPDLLPKPFLPTYYHYLAHLYRELEMFTIDPVMHDEYHQLSLVYRDSLQQVSDPHSVIFLQRRCIALCADGNYDEAKTVNDEWMEKVVPGTINYSTMAYYRAEIFGSRQENNIQKYWLATSAISEITCSDMNLQALWRLADILSGEGDIDRAMLYIDFSWNSISKFSTHKRAWFIAPIMNDIHNGYQKKVNKARSQLFILTLIIGLLAVFFLSALIYAIRKRRIAVAARAEVSLRNQQLSELNEQLSTLNSQLKESNRVKDEYIREFLQMCSTYIDKIDNYRIRINRKLKANQIKDLMKMTDSEDMKNEERQELMDHFDAVFLHLFPTFIDDFNLLLKPEARICPAKPSSMNTVLRIFALVRLGIDESSKIAEFLDYSANSIYNYRSRVKKDALISRDDFETEVKQIGSSAI